MVIGKGKGINELKKLSNKEMLYTAIACGLLFTTGGNGAGLRLLSVQDR